MALKNSIRRVRAEKRRVGRSRHVWPRLRNGVPEGKFCLKFRAATSPQTEESTLFVPVANAIKRFDGIEAVIHGLEFFPQPFDV